MSVSLDSLKTDLVALSTSRFISKWIFDKIPYVFSDNEDNYIIWRENIANKIAIDPSDILISGSACIGYSLSPYKQFKPFDETSDVDICIISQYYFDTAWNELLLIKDLPQDRRMKEAILDHRSRLIYWGTIATDKILPLLSFGLEWDRIINESKSIPELKSRDINFRIYKDRISIRRYLGESVKKCIDNINIL